MNQKTLFAGKKVHMPPAVPVLVPIDEINEWYDKLKKAETSNGQINAIVDHYITELKKMPEERRARQDTAIKYMLTTLKDAETYNDEDDKVIDTITKRVEQTLITLREERTRASPVRHALFDRTIETIEQGFDRFSAVHVLFRTQRSQNREYQQTLEQRTYV